ncbi:hypothetical protein MMC24_001074 [Lignoscripta atroalba]|nr:hypothetical protein [Lignoscripta atroalba]
MAIRLKESPKSSDTSDYSPEPPQAPPHEEVQYPAPGEEKGKRGWKPTPKSGNDNSADHSHPKAGDDKLGKTTVPKPSGPTKPSKPSKPIKPAKPAKSIKITKTVKTTKRTRTKVEAGERRVTRSTIGKRKLEYTKDDLDTVLKRKRGGATKITPSKKKDDKENVDKTKKDGENKRGRGRKSNQDPKYVADDEDDEDSEKENVDTKAKRKTNTKA